ncbi:MAG: hypothetical protein ACI94Y_002146 [Maribacter sp.]|jgi:hypothetical protein
MSDKNIYNEDFINKGWQDMSAILDKEMPVKKKKRFFILFSFGLLSVIALGLTLVPMRNSEIGLDEIIAVQPVVNQLIDINDNSEKIADLNEKINSDVLVDKYEKTSALKTHSTIEKQNNTTLIDLSKNSYSNNRNDIVTSINKVDINENNLSIKEELLTTPIIKNESSINANPSITSIVENESLIINQRSLINYLDPIALNFPLLENDKVEEIKKIPNHFNPKKWNFGIEAGFVFQNKNELGGKIGFVATRHINKKWALHTGLEYNAHFINYGVAESAEAFEVADDQLNNGDNIIEMGNYEALYLNNPTKITSHHLRIPILVAYRFHPSLEVNAGIVNDFNVYSRDRNNMLANPSIGLVFPLATVAESKTIKPFYDPQASLGLTYYPIKKWGISLRYDHGFIKKEITATIPESAYQAASKSSVGIKGYGSHYRLLNISAKMYF